MMDILNECLTRIEKAGGMYGAPLWLIEEFENPKDVVEMKVRAVTHNGKENFDAVRVLQTNPYPTGDQHPFKGGWRYMSYPSHSAMIKAMRALAIDMNLKIALTGLPFGGSKGCLNIDPSRYTFDEREAITKELVFEMLCRNILGPYIDVPGPDYGTSSEEMKWMYIAYGRHNQLLHRPNPAAVVTGKPIDYDGIPGREDATARGGLIVFQEIVKLHTDYRVAIQGYGNVGRNACKLLQEENYWKSGTIVAVTDAKGGVYNPKGILFIDLDAYYRKNGTFAKCPLGDFIRPDEITEAGEYDLFITAAKEGLLNIKNAPELKARYLLELGNAAITTEAEHVLLDRGIEVIPDILANPGGVIVSSLEWRKNLGDSIHAVDMNYMEQWVHNTLAVILKQAVRTVVNACKQTNSDLRTAAHVVALQKLEYLLRMKHGYQ